MTVTIKMPQEPRTLPEKTDFGALYHRAKQVANQCGYKGVTLAHTALMTDPNHPFTKRQARAIFKGYAQLMATMRQNKADQQVAAAANTTTAVTVTGNWEQWRGTNYKGYSYKVKPLAKERDAIVLRIATYHARNVRGEVNRTETAVDDAVHLTIARSATTDLWNAAIEAGGAANVLDGAYGCADGMPFVDLDPSAQDEIMAATKMVREAMQAIKHAVLLIDRTNTRMEPAKEGDGANDAATSIAAD